MSPGFSAGATATPTVRAIGIGKTFPGVVALADVDLELHAGEVRALLGKNGAGKSTLVKILAGIYQPDTGHLEMAGERISFSGPSEAQTVGISMVHQELSLVPGLSVAENVFLGSWPQVPVGILRRIDQSAMRNQALGLFKRLGVQLDPSAIAGKLSPAEQQLTEIAKAISTVPKILILDEPTSSLVRNEVELVLEAVRNLSSEGVSVVYVSHRMDEIPKIADSITVLRDGRHAATGPLADYSTKDVARLIVGNVPPRRKDAVVADGSERRQTGLLLEARGLCNRVLNDVDLDIGRGEVIGLVGLLGSGRTEVLRSLAGADRLEAGTIEMNGATVRRPTPQRMRQLGVGLVPEDRKGQGLVLDLSVAENLTMASLNRASWAGWLRPRIAARLVNDVIERLSIVAPSARARAALLSGGNQQKIVFGKWLNAQVDVLLLDEPTRGVDIEAKSQIYELVRNLSAQGKGILFVSSEVEEIFVVCTRVIVLQAGEVVSEHLIDDLDVSSAQALSMGERETVACD